MKTALNFPVKEVFAEEFSTALGTEIRKSGFPVEDWFYSGRQKPLTSQLWWIENGADVCQRYIDWYESNDDVSVWISPDGPAIELSLEVLFGDVLVRMQIDQVLQVGTALIVVDLKASAKAPDSNRQLGIYACGIERAYGIRPKYGAYFVAREETPFQRPIDLGAYEYSFDYFEAEFAMFEQAKKSGIFLANPGRSCGRCGVAHACLAAGGARAKEFDPSHPHNRN